MKANLKNTVQKVPEQTRGTLTPTRQVEEFPQLPTPTDVGTNEGSVNPFERRSRLSRSPTQTTITRFLNPGEDSAVVDKPPATDPPKDTETPSPYDAVITLARQEEEEHLRKCLSTLAVMKAATGRQKNISQDVKDGILTLEVSLQHIIQLRRSWQSCESVSCSTQTSPSLRRPAQPSGSKRAASSPVEPEVDKKKKSEGTIETDSVAWSKVVGRKSRKQKAPQQKPENQAAETANMKPVARKKKKHQKQRPDAILIKPLEGKSYADVLGEIRQKAKPEEKGALIKGLRKTRAGDLLVELAECSESKSTFGAELQTILGDNATVRVLEPKTTLEVRDLDELTTEEEVEGVVRSVLGGSVELKTFVSRANSRGQRMAILTIGARDAAKLLEKGRLKIGWVNARVREKPVAPRCFRCLGYGHVANRCCGPDRSKQCYKCGGQDHKASTCTATESCVLCTEAGLKDEQVRHSAGSNHCGAYKQALQKLRANKIR